MSAHGIPARQPKPASLRSPANGNPGLFGRLFDLPPLEVPDSKLLALAKEMKDTATQELDPQGDASIPAGITYLGQFIDHDVTLDTTSLDDQAGDPDAQLNFRTPGLDLDSVYGLGPSGSAHLYARDPVSLKVSAKLLVGTAAESPDLLNPGVMVPALPGHDLPRVADTGTALIADPRNDENLLVAQIHVAFLRFHNKVVDKVCAEQNLPATDPRVFDLARQQVTWHYQWIVLNEFLEAITGEIGISERIMAQGRRHFRFVKRPFMPVEYSVAAFRFGHSMVREVYSHNRIFRPGGAVPASLQLLFDFTAKSGRIAGNLVPAAVPLPQPVLPSNWVIDWRRFFDFSTPAAPSFALNRTRKLDAHVTPTLHTLPGEAAGRPEAILPFRNLKRGVKMGLPSGQAVAQLMGVPVLTQAEITRGNDGAMLKAQGLHEATPLWYYILKEAEARGNGNHLGPVGATIVAEVLVGLVQGSTSSYLSASPRFRPSLGPSIGHFTMADLIAFSDAINPVG